MTMWKDVERQWTDHCNSPFQITIMNESTRNTVIFISFLTIRNVVRR